MLKPERRLCMVVHGPYPVSEPRVVREALAAQKDGWTVDVVALARPGEPRSEICEGIHVYRVPLTHRRGTSAARMAFEYLLFTVLSSIVVFGLFVRRRHAVVQVHNPPDFLIVAGLLPKLFGARLVFDVHDLAPDMFSMRFPSARAGRVLRRIERTAAGASDAVVTVHDPYRRELEARGVKATKLAVVMNSLDETLLPDREPTRTAPFRIVYHGTVTPGYGVELVVEALPQVVDLVDGEVVFEIYGEGDSLPRIAERARELEVSDSVSISSEYMSHADVLRRINGASVGVIPNRAIPLNRFALSSKLFEYVLLGIPVVSARLPTIYEYFGEEALTYFEPDDPTSLATALVAVARQPEQAQQRTALARERYEPLRWERSANRYTTLLASLDPLGGAATDVVRGADTL